MRSKMFLGLILTSAFLFVSLTGCAMGNKHGYDKVFIVFNGKSMNSIAVATHDQRRYVIMGDKEPDFVGLQRGGYGNPFSVYTESGNSLAEDMTKSISGSLTSRDFVTTEVIVNHADDKNSIREVLKNQNVSRSILLTLYEWKSDTYQNTAIKYDIRLEVLDRYGDTIAEKRISGEDDLGGSFWNPAGHAKKAVASAFREKIEELLNSNKIFAALTG